MNLSDRIQALRREKGLSQEELAEQIGVSRQAVSKWESAQFSPDIDKIIQLSEFFGTTTDYLLKGVTPTENPARSLRQIAPTLLTIIGIALSILALLMYAIIRVENASAWAVFWGVAVLLLSGLLFYIGQKLRGNSDIAGRKKASLLFSMVGVWAFSMLPAIGVYNLLIGILWSFGSIYELFPFLKSHYSPIFVSAGYWLLYAILCTLTDFWIWHKHKRSNHS